MYIREALGILLRNGLVELAMSGVTWGLLSGSDDLCGSLVTSGGFWQPLVESVATSAGCWAESDRFWRPLASELSQSVAG